MTTEWLGKKPNEVELAWFAGFVDGEGTIHFSVEKKTGVIQPRFNLVNTSLAAAEQCKRILSMVLQREIRWEVRPAKYNWLPQYKFRVKNHEEEKVLLEMLLPYLICKKPQAELMLRYLAVKPGKGGRFQSFHYDFVNELKQLNRPNWEERLKNGRYPFTFQRETKRLAPNEGDVIVQTAQQCAEVAEMTTRLTQ